MALYHLTEGSIDASVRHIQYMEQCYNSYKFGIEYPESSWQEQLICV